MIDLEKLRDSNFSLTKNGHVASYIPALARVSADQLGIAVYDLKNNKLYKTEQSDIRFAIESISKVITLLYAIKQRGFDEVNNRVSTRQTGFAFNSILNLEIEHENKPLNPFVNAGAIMTTSLIKPQDELTPFEQILAFAQEICHDPDLSLDEEIFYSEDETGDIDRSLAYYLKAHKMIQDNVTDSLRTYFKQCSMKVTAVSLANLGAVLANDGVKPWDNERIISSRAATFTKSLMMTTGLYNESGVYSARIGVPTKSGVGGGLMSAVPNKYGIGIFSPSLDKDGNSVAGLGLLTDLSDALKLDIFK
ncbi:glutaminase A [Lactobacillus hominis]|uniref:Glutaminase n=2 Tax=Lactobacillus hominis TaxID=1203033 RepID=I7JUU9_9LACO|nr:glutaminase A [Lactobacillus hominis]KRM84318.1 glutaminase a [Lactobacillus hominis DSM 23910 = CRBIP 24.179]MCT3348213.1 glutaminase A [Lactobacillus hominis]CCI81726.1 Glutaminase 1 [Lactobacillus hominis DSM 23910 = CRBIP 24.179]